MCQRVVIALALACNPQLLIADEPTTGLDVTTQKAVMDLIVELTKRRRMSTILITHDLGLAAAYCDRVVVMEKGRVVETAKSADIFANPEHAYTKKLMRATPRLGVSLARSVAGGRSGAQPRGRPDTGRSLNSACDPQATRARSTPPPHRKAGQGISAPGRHRRARQTVLPQAAGRARNCSARSTASASPSVTARASAWSANPAAASPPRR